MLIPVAAAIVGALVMGSTKPRTAYTKTRSIGSQSGISYEVEDFKGAGFIVVRAPDGSEGVFSRRQGKAGFDWSRGRGSGATLKLMRADFDAAPVRPSPPEGKKT
jgi:hypothetical protein